MKASSKKSDTTTTANPFRALRTGDRVALFVKNNVMPPKRLRVLLADVTATSVGKIQVGKYTLSTQTGKEVDPPRDNWRTVWIEIYDAATHDPAIDETAYVDACQRKRRMISDIDLRPLTLDELDQILAIVAQATAREAAKTSAQNG